MNKKYIAKVVLIVLFILTTYEAAFSQNSNLLYYFENVPQTNLTNPAMMPRANGFLSFPGISSVAVDFHSDIAAKDLIQNVDGVWVQPLDAAFDYSEFYKSFGSSMSVSAAIGYSPLYFGFRTGDGYFTFSVQQKVSANITLPKDIFQLAEKGFENGDVLDLQKLSTKIMAYHEISIGYAQDFGEKLTLGIHVKPLIGIAATQMEYNKLSVSNAGTSYELQMDGNIYSSVPYLTVTPDENGYPDEVEFPDTLETSDYVDALTDFSNIGVALDLGVVYDLNRSFTLSAALNNLGYIKWKENLNSVSAKGTYNFEGPDVSVTEMDDMEDAYSDIADSIQSVMNATTANEKFSTSLSPELMLGAAYHVNHVIDLGFLAKSTFAKYNFRQEFVLSGNMNFYKTFSANLAYNYEIKGGSDLGLGMSFRGGPMQLYFMLNHIPYNFDKVIWDDESHTLPTKAQSASVMFGVNFLFGRHGFRNKPMID